MNFLLYMIGSPHRGCRSDVTRPGPRQQLLRAAATACAHGKSDKALQLWQRLDNFGDPSLTDTLILAHLQLATRNHADACDSFDRAISRALGESPAANLLSDNAGLPLDTDYLEAFDAGNLRGTQLERLISDADLHLRNGRYVRAIDAFQRARHTVDILLCATTGLILAHARSRDTLVPPPHAASPLLPLARLSDLLLRMLARTHLASNLAQGLRQRDLRADLAPWATTRHTVDHLLDGEFQPLLANVHRDGGHAESNFRLGLVARALGRSDVAAAAFTRVLNVHPHHILSASLLAATLLRSGKGEAAMPLLAISFSIPTQTLERYHALAAAAQDPPAFERTVNTLCTATDSPSQRSTLKANLAFALNEMDLLDADRARWRNPVPA